MIFFLLCFWVGKLLLTYLHAHWFLLGSAQSTYKTTEDIIFITAFEKTILAFLFDSFLEFSSFCIYYIPPFTCCPLFFIRALCSLITDILNSYSDNFNLWHICVQFCCLLCFHRLCFCFFTSCNFHWKLGMT